MKRIVLAALLAATPGFAQTAPEGARVEVNGMQMYYEVSGQGDPLVLLHGAYMSIPAMGDIVGALAEGHTVYAVEMQGHGRTTDIDRPITYEALAGDVAAFMEKVGLEKADVVGYSMGAATGLRLAIDHPEKVERLVTISGGFDVMGWQQAFRDMIPTMSVEMFAGMPMEAEYRKLAANPEGFPALAAKLIQLEKEPMAWGEEVRGLKMPVLIIAGDADVSTVEHNVEMLRLLGGGGMGDMGQPLPSARLAILPASSHTSVIGQTDILMAFIDPFLKGEAPKGWFDQ